MRPKSDFDDFHVSSSGVNPAFTASTMPVHTTSAAPSIAASSLEDGDLMTEAMFCRTSQVSHDRGWRGVCVCTIRDRHGRCAVATGSAYFLLLDESAVNGV